MRTALRAHLRSFPARSQKSNLGSVAPRENSECVSVLPVGVSLHALGASVSGFEPLLSITRKFAKVTSFVLCTLCLLLSQGNTGILSNSCSTIERLFIKALSNLDSKESNYKNK